MNPKKIESELSKLGANWPVASVAESVSRRLQSLPASQIVKPHTHRLQWTLAGSIVILVVAWSIIWTTTPASFAAQMKASMRKAASAHIEITSVDAKDKRQKSDIWYSREYGIRVESTGELIVDNGKQQWTWNPTVAESERVVSQRASHEGIKMIAEMLQLENAPGDWRQSRKPEFDRIILGQSCEATLVEPPENVSATAEGDSTPSPLRIIAWLDRQHRILRFDAQHLIGEKWVTRREAVMEYDVEIAADKFAVHFPPSTRIVDADHVWSTRFPVEKSLATMESGGLMFAIHELVRCENDQFYVVSSVRGTPEHLKKFPPRKRRMNLQYTALDVACQGTGATVRGDLEQAMICSTEEGGVNYLWWIAAPRKSFRIKDSVRIDLTPFKKLEIEPGKVRIPLFAFYTDRDHSENVNAQMDVHLADITKPETLLDIAGRSLRDAKLSREGLLLSGAVNNGTMTHVMSTMITAAEYAKQLGLQLEWLNSFDEVPEGTWTPMATAFPPRPLHLPQVVRGMVVDPEGKPVANAKVTVEIKRFQHGTQYQDASLPEPWVVLTNEQGQYEFTTEEPLLLSEDLLYITTEIEGFPKLETTDYEREVEQGTLPLHKFRYSR